MHQTRLESLLEQFINLGSGFIIAYAIWRWVLRPLIYAGYMTIDDSMMITIIFTVVSIVRGYVWRRLFNKGVHKMVHRWVTTLCRSN